MYISKQFLNSKIQDRSLNENYAYNFAQRNNYDIFVSYSYNDKVYAKRIVELLG
ncbi:MAG: hypothetical protein FD133_1656 [Erysipelotrichaceae bacterium]|nr:MAG: hypothetical protein FD133_1656 [Erysipelotrichaceae bacterium]